MPKAAAKKPSKKAMKEQPKDFAIMLVKTDKGYFIQLNRDDRSVASWPTVVAAIRDIEDAYNRKHYSTYEGSMSACINWIFFQRAVVACKSLNDLKRKLLVGNPANMQVVELSHVSGFMLGLRADDTKAERAWNAAEQPRLIS